MRNAIPIMAPDAERGFARTPGTGKSLSFVSRHMGLDAQVIAIGPYSSEVASSLEYGESFYVGVAPGTVIVTNVFLAGTSEDSHKLASAFGVGAMELGKHKLNPDAANVAELVNVFGENNVAEFQCLARNGFSFFYLPNA